MQNDFIDGALGTAEAEKIVENVVKKIKSFRGMVLATRDTHEENYLNTQEGKKLPVKHCIRNTEGWEIHPEIGRLISETPVDKDTFGSIELGEFLKTYHEHKEAIEDITLVGLCTDICVISNAMILKAMFPEVPVKVDASCCAGVTLQSHSNALEAMKMCQIEIENEDCKKA